MAETSVLAKKATKSINGKTPKTTATKSKPAPVTVAEKPTPKTVKSFVNLDDRINRFEKLRGLANKREKLVQTLGELTRFNFNTDDATFMLQDSSGMHFKTGNTNLIKLVTSQLQQTLENRKTELETEILVFEL